MRFVREVKEKEVATESVTLSEAVRIGEFILEAGDTIEIFAKSEAEKKDDDEEYMDEKEKKIKESVQLPGTDIVLEAGDKIRILSEGFWTKTDSNGYSALVKTMEEGREDYPVMASPRLIAEMSDSEKRELVQEFERYVFKGN